MAEPGTYKASLMEVPHIDKLTEKASAHPSQQQLDRLGIAAAPRVRERVDGRASGAARRTCERGVRPRPEELLHAAHVAVKLFQI